MMLNFSVVANVINNILLSPDGSRYCEHYYYYGTLCYCLVDGKATPLNGTACSDYDECAVNNGGCEHNCVNSQGSYQCTCNPGFKLQANGHGCEDVNECDGNKNGCQAGCVNTMGGYYCQCPAHRILSASSVSIADREVSETDCRGFPGNHEQGYTCTNPITNFGIQACECQTKQGGVALVRNTGGCLSEYW